jgi:hypothetical protein
VPSLSPPGWDSQSFAETLWQASHGQFQGIDLSELKIIRNANTIEVHNSPKTLDQSSRTKPAKITDLHLQKNLYKVILETCHSPGCDAALKSTLTRRIRSLFTPYDIDFVNMVKLDLCTSSLNSISVSDRTKVIKTWLNGWATTYRIKGDFFHSCLLGCNNEPDSQAHYLMCPRIYASMRHVVPSTSGDPLIRCGLCNPSKESFLSVACTFFAYHALKARINNEFSACIPINVDMTPYWIFFAQSFSAEAVERALSRTFFDPSSFLNSCTHSFLHNDE